MAEGVFRHREYQRPPRTSDVLIRTRVVPGEEPGTFVEEQYEIYPWGEGGYREDAPFSMPEGPDLRDNRDPETIGIALAAARKRSRMTTPLHKIADRVLPKL